MEKSAAQNVGLLILFQDRLPRTTLISASSLYTLITRRDKPEPKKEYRAATPDDLRRVEHLRAKKDDPATTEAGDT